MIFVDILLPVFLVIAAGYLFQRKARLDFSSLSRVALDVFTPALVFTSLLESPLEWTHTLNLGLFMVAYTALMLLAGFTASRLLRFDEDTTRALLLAAAMMNVGNFGLPLTHFAFGDAGRETSMLVFVLFNLSLGTVAVMIAQGKVSNWQTNLKETLKIPLFAAAALALLLKALELHPPGFIFEPLALLGSAAVPCMLLLLGMQLARTRFQGNLGFLGVASLLRLCLGPLVALGLCLLLGIEDPDRRVVIVQTSTPAAVLPLLYCLRFGTRPDLVAGAILTTTLLCSLSLWALLGLLG